MRESGIWAAVPVKALDRAKERLSGVLSPALRRALALAMLEDVLETLRCVDRLEGLALVTADAVAARLGARYGARLIEAGAAEGHTAAIAAAARLFASEGKAGMATIPGDIPLVTPSDIASILEAHDPGPAFTIVPSHDDRGSNAVLLSPPDAVPLKFGENSFFPHLRAAERRGIKARVVRLSGIALDIDTPSDLARFGELERHTRTRALLVENGFLAGLAARREPIGGVAA
jgi:2-phospho-L-lactate guanylyltransferase